jgi:hypothetical protein
MSIEYQIEWLDENGDAIAMQTIWGDDPAAAESRARREASAARSKLESNCYATEVKRVRLVDPDGRELDLRQRKRRRRNTHA